jgi:ABC-type methionine transport system permease subunit
MPSASPISLAARERLRDHQAVTAKAVGGHAAALVRLETAASRRADVVARQDVLVAIAAAEVASAVVEAARVMGTDVAATVLDLRKTEVRRILKEAQIKEAQ